MKPAATDSPKRIAICVDDFGLHDGVNAAVFDLAVRGRVQAVGCLVGGPAFAAGSTRLAGLDEASIDVGLHLDFTEHPLHAGSRQPLRALILRAYGRQLDAALVRTEIHAQLDAFEAALRRPPAFIDGHQHVHQLPTIREALLQVLSERGSPARPWLRSTRQPAGAWGFKPWLIEALGAAPLARLAAARGLAQNAHLLGVYDFQGDADGYAARLAAWLAGACEGDVLMCHPSLPTAAADALLPARRNEHAVLSAPALNAALARARVALAPISRLLR